MISYERIDKCEGTNFEIKGSECMICHYWYFSNGFNGFKYHNFSMSVQNLRDFCIVTIKNIEYRVYIAGVDKKVLLVC